MSSAFEKIQIRAVEIKNRFAAASVGRNLADIDGHISDELFGIYKELADGGAGLIIFEMTMVSPEDYPIPGFTRLQTDDVIPEYRKLTDDIHKAGAKVVAQLATGSWFRNNGDGEPVQLSVDEMTVEELEKAESDFIQGAIRAKEAGFDGIELHLAHGFLLNKLLSPAFNHRTDSYGGDTKRRTEAVLRIIRGIRSKCGDFLIMAKVNSTDGQPDGLQAEESIQICQMLEAASVDAIEVSGMNATVSKIRPGENEGYYADFGVELKKVVNIPVILTGGHRSIEHIEMLIEKGVCDMVSIARPLIREPGMIARWQNGNEKPSDCVSCNLCVNMKGHKCIRGTLKPDGSVIKNERL